MSTEYTPAIASPKDLAMMAQLANNYGALTENEVEASDLNALIRLSNEKSTLVTYARGEFELTGFGWYILWINRGYIDRHITQ